MSNLLPVVPLFSKILIIKSFLAFFKVFFCCVMLVKKLYYLIKISSIAIKIDFLYIFLKDMLGYQKKTQIIRSYLNHT